MELNIQTVLAKLINMDGCVFYPVAVDRGSINESVRLPNDLMYFYEQYDGAILFKNSDYPFSIPKFSEFIRTDYLLLDFLTPSEFDEYTKNSITLNWYCIGEGESLSEYLSIDLSPERIGWIFICNWRIYAGECYLIAKSFTELLNKIIESEGNYQFWDEIPTNDRIYPKDLGFL